MIHTSNSFHLSLLAASIGMILTAPLSHAQESDEQQESSDSKKKTEVISVSATRRVQSISEVPYNISAVEGETLKQAGITDLGELTKRIPGISYTDRGARSGAFSTSIAMRGLSLEDGRVSGPLYTAPGVSTYIGETPLFANIRFYDISRVEVLRGPQGTLYGSGSLGGTLRFIPNKPDLLDPDLELSSTFGQTENGDGFDSELNFVGNLPITDNFAVRANFGHSDMAGWIDQPRAYVRGQQGQAQPLDANNYLDGEAAFESRQGINSESSDFGRFSALWQVNENVQALLAYNKQKDESQGNPSRAVDFANMGKYETAALIAEPYSGDIQLWSLDVDVDLGFAGFTASISDYESSQYIQSDQTGAYQAFDFFADTYGSVPRPLVEDYSTSKDAASIIEVRLVSQDDGPLSWVVGGFYMDQSIDISNYQFSRGYADWADACAAASRFDCGLGTTTGDFSLLFEPGTHPVADAAGLEVLKDKDFLAASSANFKDTAFFAEVSYQLSPKWQVTGGLRAFEQEFDNQQTNAAFFVDYATKTKQFSEEKDVLFKFNSSYQISDSLMAFVTRSEGFRRGGANALPVSVTLFDDEGNGTDISTNPNLASYTPDTVTNLEVGLKGQTHQHRYSLALFNIDWQDIQLDALVTPFLLNAVLNAGSATSRGIEAEYDTYIGENVDLTLGYSYVDAVLDNPDPIALSEAGIDAASIKGRHLPGVPKHTASIDVNYTHELDNDWFMIVGLNGNYRSDAQSQLDQATSTTTNGYAMFNSYVTFESDNWSFRIFANNLLNEQGVIHTPHALPAGPRRNELLSRPRSIGLNVAYRFD